MTKGDRAFGDASAASAEGLVEAGWEVLTLGDAAEDGLPILDVGFVFAHPAFGVALVDLLRPRSSVSVSRLYARLEAVGFSRRFPGHLPIVHRVLDVGELWRLSRSLESAFASQPPLGVAEGWIDLAQRALLPRAGEEIAPPSTFQETEEPELSPADTPPKPGRGVAARQEEWPPAVPPPVDPATEPAAMAEVSGPPPAVPPQEPGRDIAAGQEECSPAVLPHADAVAAPAAVAEELELPPANAPFEPAGGIAAGQAEWAPAVPPPVDAAAEPMAMAEEPQPPLGNASFEPVGALSARPDAGPPATRELYHSPAIRPQTRRGFWFAVAALLLAAIGLSHHLILPDGWAARLHLTQPASPDPG